MKCLVMARPVSISGGSPEAGGGGGCCEGSDATDEALAAWSCCTALSEAPPAAEVA